MFVPINRGEIAQFKLVKPRLEALGHVVVAIAQDEEREVLLRDAGFCLNL